MCSVCKVPPLAVRPEPLAPFNIRGAFPHPPLVQRLRLHVLTTVVHGKLQMCTRVVGLIREIRTGDHPACSGYIQEHVTSTRALRPI
ncbi:hypothetical protein PGT21_011028 [Puccinia graminis f. sp. tritici]|uniref:Uncharacterized protein n=1 Tax=Puccinia graminis f. sp. tritici TaxID=56615 RepID=A0A5B0MV91_PUCGR|nr:hypothetical protein PGT21_011028 [Puccinia graminis f. sp. tritici]KAA1116022.1 hypothetical protein PGTUg99_032756 [Puccinia graminis f. sp. tritici]KAA1131510.1 hypothetical protein PGTUg99_023465 [Puccinia graminis f. sp. tritici]